MTHTAREARKEKAAMSEHDEQVESQTEGTEQAEAVEETPVEFTTVREFRHAAKSVLVEARALLKFRSDDTKEVYTLLNGVIENIVKGVQGLSQEQQVERLYDATEQAKENREKVVAAAEAARDAIIEQAQALPERAVAALDSAIETLEAGREFAENRDFKAHQSKKRRSRGTYGGYGRRGYRY